MTHHQLKYLLWSVVVGATLSLTACMKWDYGDAVEDFNATGAGLFITNEGNFQYGNASLSYYDPETKQVQNEVFFRANGMKLGDVAQSMTIYDNKGWVVVNNSHVIFAIDLNTFKEVGRITGFTSPRYIHFLSDEKAYVTQIWDPRIYIVNPKTYQITGYVETDMDFETGSTEQMVQYDKYVFTNCWSYQNRILVIDTETDKVCDQITVVIQPTSLVIALLHRRRNPQDRETVQVQIRRLALRSAAQRHTRHALLHQQGGLAPAGNGRQVSGKTIPSLQQYALLRTDDQPCQFGSLYRRRDRLRAERCRTALFARRRTARRILCRDHPRRLLLALII